jgi:EPS-associated MarR family transcriptional regulator
MERQLTTSPSGEVTSRDSLEFELLYLIETEPGLTQRQIADRLGISLGKTNYCLKALTGKGAIKFANFRASKNKLRYIYVLTPKGVSQRLAMTQRFLQRKLGEYERLKFQIESLERTLPGPGWEDSDD